MPQYVTSLREAVLDDRGGILIESVHGAPRLTFLSPSGKWRGPGGNAWILAGYNLGYENWATGFQPRAAVSLSLLTGGTIGPTMVTTTELARRIDRDLWLMSADIADLSKREASWDEDRNNGNTGWLLDRDAWDYEWRNNAAIIGELSEHYQKNRMSPDQEHRYEEMLEALRQIVPVLKRIGYMVPSVALEQSPDE